MATPRAYTVLLGYDELVESETLLFTTPAGFRNVITDIEVFAQVGGSINPLAGYALFGFGGGAQWSIGLPLAPGPQAPYTHNQWTGRLVVDQLVSWYGACHGLSSVAATITGFQFVLPP